MKGGVLSKRSAMETGSRESTFWSGMAVWIAGGERPREPIICRSRSRGLVSLHDTASCWSRLVGPWFAGGGGRKIFRRPVRHFGHAEVFFSVCKSFAAHTPCGDRVPYSGQINYLSVLLLVQRRRFGFGSQAVHPFSHHRINRHVLGRMPRFRINSGEEISNAKRGSLHSRCGVGSSRRS